MIKWEQITEEGDTWRLPVPGGWIVRYDSPIAIPLQEGLGYEWKTCITFVPDLEHLWAI